VRTGEVGADGADAHADILADGLDALLDTEDGRLCRAVHDAVRAVKRAHRPREHDRTQANLRGGALVVGPVEESDARSVQHAREVNVERDEVRGRQLGRVRLLARVKAADLGDARVWEHNVDAAVRLDAELEELHLVLPLGHVAARVDRDAAAGLV